MITKKTHKEKGTDNKMKQITLDCSLFPTSSTLKYNSIHPRQMT